MHTELDLVECDSADESGESSIAAGSPGFGSLVVTPMDNPTTGSHTTSAGSSGADPLVGDNRPADVVFNAVLAKEEEQESRSAAVKMPAMGLVGALVSATWTVSLLLH